jgi:hypothetical protein
VRSHVRRMRGELGRSQGGERFGRLLTPVPSRLIQTLPDAMLATGFPHPAAERIALLPERLVTHPKGIRPPAYVLENASPFLSLRRLSQEVYWEKKRDRSPGAVGAWFHGSVARRPSRPEPACVARCVIRPGVLSAHPGLGRSLSRNVPGIGRQVVGGMVEIDHLHGPWKLASRCRPDPGRALA